MLRGVYASASGMLAGASSQRIISNNVANMNTPGHRAEYPTLSPFGALFLQRTDAGGAAGGFPVGYTNAGTRVSGIHISDAAGRIHATGGQADLALDGPGYFVLEGDQGTVLTRNGRFMVDADGYLASAEGHRLTSTTGLLQVGDGSFTVKEDGMVYAGEQAVGQIAAVDPDPGLLQPLESGLFRVSEPVDTGGGPGVTNVLQGFLELSNADMVTEITRLMAAQRGYQANHTAFGVQDRTLDETLRLPEGV